MGNNKVEVKVKDEEKHLVLVDQKNETCLMMNVQNIMINWYNKKFTVENLINKSMIDVVHSKNGQTILH